MSDQRAEGAILSAPRVVLAVMSLEPHGGVADQITNLAIELPRYGIQPFVLVRNPLSRNHAYANILKQSGVSLWAFSDAQYQLVRRICSSLLFLALPLAGADALLRRKTLSRSQQSLWGVLRGLGYAGLDAAFWLRLVYARTIKRVRLVHFRKPDAWLRISTAKRLGFCTVYTEDTLPELNTQHYYDGLAQVQQSVDFATAVSKASGLALKLSMRQPMSVAIIPNMVAVPHPAPLKQQERDGFVVGCIARLTPPKDIETLMLAAREAVARMPSLRFMIHGDGPLRTNLEELALKLGLERNLTFAGAFAKPQLADVLSNIDLIVLSSLYEGFGVSLVEGMAYGKPAVATAVGGISEVVVDGVTGILVPPRSPRALADAILTLAQDRQLYERMARAARERYLAHYRPEQVVPQYLTAYECALGLRVRTLSEEI